MKRQTFKCEECKDEPCVLVVSSHGGDAFPEDCPCGFADRQDWVEQEENSGGGGEPQIFTDSTGQTWRAVPQEVDYSCHGCDAGSTKDGNRCHILLDEFGCTKESSPLGIRIIWKIYTEAPPVAKGHDGEDLVAVEAKSIKYADTCTYCYFGDKHEGGCPGERCPGCPEGSEKSYYFVPAQQKSEKVEEKEKVLEKVEKVSKKFQKSEKIGQSDTKIGLNPSEF